MTSAAPRLFATAATVEELARARAVVVLIGGYDGSGNYGDLAQFDATLGLLGALQPGVLPLPVLERSRLAGHEALRDELEHRPAHCLFFDSPETASADGLQPAPAPSRLAFAACLLYGGGYLNRAWGARKLAMLAAAEALLDGASGPVRRLAAGLQADGEWLAGLDGEDRERLRSFELLGARDSRSAAALGTLDATGPVFDSGDDATGLLRRLPMAAQPRPQRARSLLLNVHAAEHEWVTGRPGSIAPFQATVAAELGRRGGLPVRVRPLVAYLDDRVDDRAAAEHLVAACAAAGVETGAPLVLRPAGLAAALAAIGEAELTLSCSYHVALTALTLGQPAILVADNPYYEQKAAGLVESFGLPDEFALASDTDPGAAAEAIAARLFDPTAAAELRATVAWSARRTRERRADVEIELLSRVAGGAVQALGDELGVLAGRLRERSAETAELITELSSLRSENGIPALGPPDPEIAAERALATVLNSRSWRLTAPLRHLGGHLRRSR